MPPRGKRKAAKENQTAKKAKVEKPRLVKYCYVSFALYYTVGIKLIMLSKVS
jgi:hypothetical protein